jgi:hypothetical protein
MLVYGDNSVIVYNSLSLNCELWYVQKYMLTDIYDTDTGYSALGE